MLKVRHLYRGVPAGVHTRDIVDLMTWCGERVPFNPPTSQRFITDNPKACTCEECSIEYGLHLLQEME